MQDLDLEKSSQSIEGSVDVMGEVDSRDCFTTCRGTLHGRRCAKIQRVCKPSLDAEGRAALTSSDQVLWTQSLLHEIATGAYEICRISPPSEFPLPDPFWPSQQMTM